MFLQKIEELKEIKGSYAKVAKEIGITRASLSAITRGVTHPSEETIIKLCKKININPEQMIAENDIASSKGEVKKVRESIAKKLSNVAASILVVALISPYFMESLSVYYVKLKKMKCLLCFRGQGIINT